MKDFPFKKIKLAIAVVIAVLALIAIVRVLKPKAIAVEIAEVQHGTYEQTIDEDGRTRAREVYTVSSIVSGNLQRISYHAGDKVKEGDVLFEVEWDHPVQVHSPVTGWILRVLEESAGPVERGQAIMEVADATSLEIVADILTTEAVKIRPGAPVRITGWGGEKTLEGKVRLVEPSAFKKISALGVEEQRVNVVIDFTSPYQEWQELGDSFRVDVHILIYQIDDALTIPTGALFREGNQWAVYQVNEGRVKKQFVEVAHRNPERTMVNKGLRAGDQVVVYPSDEIKEGTTVRAQDVP